MGNWTPKYIELKIRASKMKELYASGKSIKDIAKAFGVSADSVYKYLHYEQVKLPKPAHDEKTGRFVGSGSPRSCSNSLNKGATLNSKIHAI